MAIVLPPDPNTVVIVLPADLKAIFDRRAALKKQDLRTYLLGRLASLAR